MRKTVYALVLVFAFCGCATNGQVKPTPVTENDHPPEPVKAKMDPGQRVAIHVAEIVKIIDKSRGDCKTSLIESLEYIEKHQADIDDGVAHLKAKDKEMGGEEQEAYMQKLMSLIEEIVPHPQQIMGAFDQKCPAQNARIGKALHLDE
ncbi:MAG: hypothetical protein JRJ87_18570 [Deltaproteobacteria bacterium]|nr:hypothetical protein [Deltaproteobacteria bacterium]